MRRRAPAPLQTDPALDGADAASDASVEGDASDASADAGADASPEPAPRRLPLDDFNDPWAKPPPANRRAERGHVPPHFSSATSTGFALTTRTSSFGSIPTRNPRRPPLM